MRRILVSSISATNTRVLNPAASHVVVVINSWRRKRLINPRRVLPVFLLKSGKTCSLALIINTRTRREKKVRPFFICCARGKCKMRVVLYWDCSQSPLILHYFWIKSTHLLYEIYWDRNLIMLLFIKIVTFRRFVCNFRFDYSVVCHCFSVDDDHTWTQLLSTALHIVFPIDIHWIIADILGCNGFDSFTHSKRSRDDTRTMIRMKLKWLTEPKQKIMRWNFGYDSEV